MEKWVGVRIWFSGYRAARVSSVRRILSMDLSNSVRFSAAQFIDAPLVKLAN
jgi:hypothetical protein